MTSDPRRKGTGGHGRRRLQGKGPTPPAHMRPGHPAARRAAGRKRAAGTRDDTAQSTEAASGGGVGSGSRYGQAKVVPGAGRGSADGPEVVAGRNAVVESLRAAAPATALYLAGRMDTDERVTEAVRLAGDAGVAVLEASRAELDRLTGGASHQGVALRVPPYSYAHPADLTVRAAGAAPLIVALDGVTDPRNLGAVARSAAAFGAHGLVIPARRSAGVTAAAWKTSAGALAHLPVARAANLVRALEDYKQAGLFIAGLDAGGPTDVADLELASDPLVLVVGSEGRGLSRLAAQRCDLVVRIPVRTESLNAGVAAGIALYEVARKRAGR